MKTATVEDLENRLSVVLGWLNSGEDVVVHGVKTPAQPAEDSPVDWKKSAVFRRQRAEKVTMTEAELQEFYRDMRGSY